MKPTKVAQSRLLKLQAVMRRPDVWRRINDAWRQKGHSTYVYSEEQIEDARTRAAEAEALASAILAKFQKA